MTKHAHTTCDRLLLGVRDEVPSSQFSCQVHNLMHKGSSAFPTMFVSSELFFRLTAGYEDKCFALRVLTRSCRLQLPAVLGMQSRLSASWRSQAGHTRAVAERVDAQQQIHHGHAANIDIVGLDDMQALGDGPTEPKARPLRAEEYHAL